MNLDLLGISALVIIFTLFLIIYRDRIHLQKILGGRIPFVYLALFRTKIGIDFMDRVARRFPNILRSAGTLAIGVGFLGMAFVVMELFYSTIKLISSPVSTGAAALVLPIEAKGIIYVPFTIWILCLAIIVTVHEFGHGVMARLYKIPIKSTGLAALGLLVPLIPAAFVEPNEKKLAKKPMKEQLAVFAAGPFVNIVVGLLLIPLLLFSLAPAVDVLYNYEGVEITSITDNPEYPIVNSALAVGTVVTSLDGTTLERVEDLTAALSDKKIGEVVILTSIAGDSYAIQLGAHPTKEGAGYLGVVSETKKSLISQTVYSGFMVWTYDLVMWLVILNLGVGLFNLLPVGIVDGGRMIKVVFEKWLKQHHASFAYAATSATCLFVVLAGVALNFMA